MSDAKWFTRHHRTISLLAAVVLAAVYSNLVPVARADDTADKAAAAAASKPAADDEKSTEAKQDKVRFALFELDGALPETGGQASLLGESQSNLRAVVDRIDKAAKDKNIAGAVLDIRNPSVSYGKIEELRGAIARFRASGKKVYAQLESAMPPDYMIACACNEIVLPESGELVLPGVRAEATFYKGLFGKLGIEADFVHIGAYKGAAEPLTQEKFSEPVRENMTALVDSMYDELVTTIVKHRPISIAQAKEIIDRGMVSATQAKELGLVDRVAYPDEFRAQLAKASQAESVVFVKNYGETAADTDFSGPTGLLKLMQAMMGSESKSNTPRGKKIAVIYAVGEINTGESKGDMFGEQSLGATTIIEALRKANADKSVVAIVLRVDSPGGSALASDLIWHETQVLRKPFVASMGDVAASGGYYISIGTNKIIAAPGTITGSIGVVGGKLAVNGLLDKVGVTTEAIARGKNSSLFAMSGKFTDSERKVILDSMETVYGQFTAKAAAGRKMPEEKLRELAGGRVYTRRRAKEIGLVDQLGTLHDAIIEAKLLAGLEKDAAIKIETLPEPKSILDSLFESSKGEEEVRLGTSLQSLSPELMTIARKVHLLRRAFDRPAALVMPFDLEIR